MNDSRLLKRYAEEGSEEAFTEFVALRVGIVYSAALRQTHGDARRAEDVTQAVFTDVARKARCLWRHRALIGWLYTSTRYAALKMARTERRRHRREEEAYAMNEMLDPGPEVIPAERLRPLLDDAMHQLSETDRHALLLRFFDGCSLEEVGRSLGLSEVAAQKRVERALAKLRGVLRRRGLASTMAAVGAALSQEAALAAPAGLAAAISGISLASSSAVAGTGIIALLTTPIAISAAVSALILTATLGLGTYLGPGSRIAGAKPGIGAMLRPPGPRPLTAPIGTTLAAEGEELPGDQGTDRSVASPGALSLLTGPRLSPQEHRPPADQTAAAPNAIVPFADSGEIMAGLRILGPSQLDQPPVPVSKLRPAYPPEMRRGNVPGEVIVDFTVDAAGRVRDTVVARSSGLEFERAAVAAVTHWRFSPGRKNGRPIETRLRIPILFKLDTHD